MGEIILDTLISIIVLSGLIGILLIIWGLIISMVILFLKEAKIMLKTKKEVE